MGRRSVPLSDPGRWVFNRVADAYRATGRDASADSLWDAMTRDAYWSVFLRERVPAHYEDLLRPPDYARAARGDHE